MTIGLKDSKLASDLTQRRYFIPYWIAAGLLVVF